MTGQQPPGAPVALSSVVGVAGAAQAGAAGHSDVLHTQYDVTSSSAAAAAAARGGGGGTSRCPELPGHRDWNEL